MTNIKTLPILVWKFDDAPIEYRSLSQHGGDEDWVVVIPPGVKLDYAPWLDRIDTMGEPQKVDMPDGSIVYIGAHA